ncbi:LysE family translocator [Hydromonas duriensis]|uniref:Threonine/homoserine/homoserine lactone efflux protein n=1 Tax=Hydromonas duriensis TaxID=1527608 RepID=A0A4R6YA70_9BURK|nr:LysE family translocator [Hydromonas duriensis]TDR32364.1 threonine/homoserine/homoserine lactone efflux protein [Hydromonas duriensis]
MTSYVLFIIMAVLTILSPGPGVLKSVTNALNYGFKSALVGVLGLSTGVFCVATLSATSLGALLAASQTAFDVLKYCGAAYLIYLGVKLWLSPAIEFDRTSKTAASYRRLFVEGLLFQFSNPKALVFFLSVFPQFINHEQNYATQFATLVLTFCVLLIVIHTTYAFFAHKVQSFLKTGRGGRIMNRMGGSAFIGFGVLLASSKKGA